MNKFLYRLIHSLDTMAIFAILFMAGGYLIPHLYFEFFDKTNYYEIKNPVEVEQRDYQACEFVKIYMIRNSQLDGQGKSIINLNLIRSDAKGGLERINTEIKEISFTKDSGLMILSWQIPCDTKKVVHGEYFFQGNMAYKIREFDRYSPFRTMNFKVVASESAKVK